jgi:hypothetical protein
LPKLEPSEKPSEPPISNESVNSRSERRRQQTGERQRGVEQVSVDRKHLPLHRHRLQEQAHHPLFQSRLVDGEKSWQPSSLVEEKLRHHLQPLLPQLSHLVLSLRMALHPKGDRSGRGEWEVGDVEEVPHHLVPGVELLAVIDGSCCRAWRRLVLHDMHDFAQSIPIMPWLVQRSLNLASRTCQKMHGMQLAVDPVGQEVK